MPNVPLAPADIDALVGALRQGRPVDQAAAVLGLDLRAVWAAARSDTRLTIALAGRDPDAAEERARAARADYLRLLALGVVPSRAELILGAGHPGGWRSADPAYARACAAVSEAAAPYGYTGQTRFTPERRAVFLKELRAGASVRAAAEVVGVTTVAIYQRRRRDGEFAAAMESARQAGRP